MKNKKWLILVVLGSIYLLMWDNNQFTDKELWFVLFIGFISFLFLFVFFFSFSQSKKKKNIDSHSAGIEMVLHLEKESFYDKQKNIEKFFQIKISRKYLGLFLILYQYINNDTYFLQREKFTLSSKKLILWLSSLIILTSMFPLLYMDTTSLSAYEISKNSSYLAKYWFFLVPYILSIIIMVNYYYNMKIKVITFLTGVSPFMIVAICYYCKFELLTTIGIAGYMVCFIGLFLIVLPLRPRRKTLCVY